MKKSLKEISRLNFKLYLLTKDKSIPWELKKELNGVINMQFLEITKVMQQLEKVEQYLDSRKPKQPIKGGD